MSYAAVKHSDEYSRALGASLDELRKMTALQLFRRGLDTLQIAHILRQPECTILKRITRERDEAHGTRTEFEGRA